MTTTLHRPESAGLDRPIHISTKAHSQPQSPTQPSSPDLSPSSYTYYSPIVLLHRSPDIHKLKHTMTILSTQALGSSRALQLQRTTLTITARHPGARRPAPSSKASVKPTKKRGQCVASLHAGCSPLAAGWPLRPAGHRSWRDEGHEPACVVRCKTQGRRVVAGAARGGSTTSPPPPHPPRGEPGGPRVQAWPQRSG
jgi:hypothetical protein